MVACDVILPYRRKFVKVTSSFYFRLLDKRKQSWYNRANELNPPTICSRRDVGWRNQSTVAE
jgi:hypothetical protein